MEHAHELLLPATAFALLYAVVLLVDWGMNTREFKRAPEKAARYRSLPLGYNLACRLGVAPLFAAGVFHIAWTGAGLVAFFILESACVRWYRRAGLF